MPGEMKNRVDAIWDTLWTSGITNPITVVEQMTYLFFMKLLDDTQQQQEATANILGTQLSNPTFPAGIWHNPDTDKDIPYADLRWHIFSQLESSQMFNRVRNDVFVFIKNLGSGSDSAYSRYMTNSAFVIPTARTLQSVVSKINNMNMNDRDTMGDVYEYMLSKVAASGKNGQFRTPRHIIRMMVNLMKPTINDTICDPAMGSAGFLVESLCYIKEHQREELLNEEHANHYRRTLLHGFDTDYTMLRIGAMNLMLHNIENPDIEYRDSLSAENTDSDCYSLCLANPPFTGSLDREATARSLTALADTGKTELLFLSLFVRMLKVGGRCASIVPDGVLFGTSAAHNAIRRELVDHQRLQAVISMPGGVFQPYSGVSTAILIFTKTNAGGTDQVWFYDMRADGLSFGKRRHPVEANDIPDIIARFANLEGEASRTRKEQSFLVPVEEIREKGYDLSLNKYREVERDGVEYNTPNVIMGNIEQLEDEINSAMSNLKKMLSV